MNKTALIIAGSVIIVIALLFSARFLGGGSGAAVSLPNSGSGQVAQTVHNGNQTTAPDFTLQGIDGNTFTLSDYRGEKPVVLDFFATWCPNCRRDMPQVSRMYDKYKDKVEVIGINLQESQKVVKNFRSTYGISFPLVLDPTGSVTRQYGIRYTNSHVLINKEGAVVGSVPGDLSEQALLSLIEL